MALSIKAKKPLNDNYQSVELSDFKYKANSYYLQKLALSMKLLSLML